MSGASFVPVPAPSTDGVSAENKGALEIGQKAAAGSDGAAN
eukprot:CAMPEP_0182599436 /NCGR_PEP_ID=MMETSP1324-20130603/90368_1 /TAXON_ID=236786 /ORGANISM="Florenciella sp., Strain RCC1587" /LENGTH=40 /DNA_ID= /DNA_START= /DNA_END= /DNA_ORIENTATION=